MITQLNKAVLAQGCQPFNLTQVGLCGKMVLENRSQETGCKHHLKTIWDNNRRHRIHPALHPGQLNN
jgi:hypothetical protein